jgi:hypothetical protein
VTELELNLLVQIPNALGLVGQQLAGRRWRMGWLVGAASEVTWAVWASFAHAYGVLPWCVIWFCGYVRNWWRWRKP